MIVLIIGSILTIKPVYALGTPQIVSINPGSPAPVGTTVSIRAVVAWDSDFRSMRICFRDTSWCQEEGTPDITKSFNTSSLSPGIYQILVQVSKQNEGWDTATYVSTGYELTSPPPPPQPSKGPNPNFEFDPSGGQTSGNNVNIHVWTSQVPGATTVNVSCGGVTKTETSESDFNSTWVNTASCSGEASVTVCSRAQDDPNWTNSTCARKSYTFSAPVNSLPLPKADFWADSTSIATGQCTNLNWQTNGADSVDIDGTNVGPNGSGKVCPTVTTKYTLTAHNSAGNTFKNVKVVVSTNPAPALSDPSSHFNQGDIIDINGRIYVIVVDGNGTRFKRWVPNPDSLDDLGISRSMVNNKGFSAEELSLIPNGKDIPDTSVNPSGFQEFKQEYFPNLLPIAHGQQSQNLQDGTVQPIPNGPQGLGSDGCPLAPPILVVGNEAVVADIDLNLRPKPNIKREPILLMPAHTRIKVISGPKCKDEVRWFEVEYHNGSRVWTGWAAEVGTGGEYHMYPVTAQPAAAPTQTPTQVQQTNPTQAPIQPQAQVAPEQGQNLAEDPILQELAQSPTPEPTGWDKVVDAFTRLLGGSDVQASGCEPSCVNEMRKGSYRPDLNDWIAGTGSTTPDLILRTAQNLKPYVPKNQTQKMLVKVREANELPQVGDLVIWPSSILKNGTGHIGYVISVDSGYVVIHDSNWNLDCKPRDVRIPIKEYLKFISSPYSADDSNTETQPKVDKCSNPTGWDVLKCMLPWNK